MVQKPYVQVIKTVRIWTIRFNNNNNNSEEFWNTNCHFKSNPFWFLVWFLYSNTYEEAFVFCLGWISPPHFFTKFFSCQYHTSELFGHKTLPMKLNRFQRNLRCYPGPIFYKGMKLSAYILIYRKREYQDLNGSRPQRLTRNIPRVLGKRPVHAS